MSATLGGGLAERVAALMSNPDAEEAAQGAGEGAASVPLLVSKGRSFDVKTHYLGLPGAAAYTLSPIPRAARCSCQAMLLHYTCCIAFFQKV